MVPGRRFKYTSCIYLFFVPQWAFIWLIPAINSLWPIAVLWRHRSASILAQVLICCLMAPSHYLNQYWFLINEDWCHSPESNFRASTQATIRPNEVENYTFKITATSPRGERVNSLAMDKMAKISYAFLWKKGLYFDLKKRAEVCSEESN